MIAVENRDFWLAMRAAHIRRAKLLQDERACVMEEIAAIERLLNIEPNERPRRIQINPGDNVSIAVVSTE